MRIGDVNSDDCQLDFNSGKSMSELLLLKYLSKKDLKESTLPDFVILFFMHIKIVSEKVYSFLE